FAVDLGADRDGRLEPVHDGRVTVLRVDDGGAVGQHLGADRAGAVLGVLEVVLGDLYPTDRLTGPAVVEGQVLAVTAEGLPADDDVLAQSGDDAEHLSSLV